MLSKELKKTILGFQKSEITEHNVYKNLARRTGGKNSGVLERISKDELKHYNKWKTYTNREVRPNKLTVLKFLIISRMFGLTFAIKMMEGGEENAQKVYGEVLRKMPQVRDIFIDETEHEKLLVDMIDEEKIGYIGSMVLGLNDALVELTGALAGLSFALQNTLLVAIAGLITGISASLSMAASEYLSQKSETDGKKSPGKASFYTGIAYIFTVLLLVSPFFVFPAYYTALGVTILMAVIVIFIFTFFTSVVKEVSFRKTFAEMLAISLGVAGISFVIGMLVRIFIGIEI